MYQISPEPKAFFFLVRVYFFESSQTGYIIQNKHNFPSTKNLSVVYVSIRYVSSSSSPMLRNPSTPFPRTSLRHHSLYTSYREYDTIREDIGTRQQNLPNYLSTTFEVCRFGIGISYTTCRRYEFVFNFRDKLAVL